MKELSEDRPWTQRALFAATAAAVAAIVPKSSRMCLESFIQTDPGIQEVCVGFPVQVLKFLMWLRGVLKVSPWPHHDWSHLSNLECWFLLLCLGWCRAAGSVLLGFGPASCAAANE